MNLLFRYTQHIVDIIMYTNELIIETLNVAQTTCQNGGNDSICIIFLVTDTSENSCQK